MLNFQTMMKQSTKASKRGRPPKPDGGMDASLTIKLPAELKEAATEKSERTGTPVSFVVRKALEAWVADSDKKATAGDILRRIFLGS